jgi:hypothetical protein
MGIGFSDNLFSVSSIKIRRTRVACLARFWNYSLPTEYGSREEDRQ